MGREQEAVTEFIASRTAGWPTADRKELPGSDEKWEGYVQGVEESIEAAREFVGKHPTGEQIERAAKAAATEFGFEWVFESDTTDENYDAAYWRHVARAVLRSALSPESNPEGQ